MKAFHNDLAVKEKYLERVRAHRLADEIIKGQYWDKDRDGVFRGCAVGCTIHGNSHAAYEEELQIPVILARLEDGIFEALPGNRHEIWPEEFLEAITVGADLSDVWPKFAVWLLTDEIHGVLQYALTEDEKKSIQIVADYYKDFKNITKQQWEDAAYAAYAAAYAAYSAAAYATADAARAASYAADAAYAAAYATADASRAAAYAADAAYTAADAAYTAANADADSYDAIREEHRSAQADKLLELLREAK